MSINNISTKMPVRLTALLCLSLVMVLSGCGIKGHLYMPKPDDEPAAQPVQDAGTGTAEDSGLPGQPASGTRPVMTDTDAASDEDGEFYFPVL